jgi:hypothetical protein
MRVCTQQLFGVSATFLVLLACQRDERRVASKLSRAFTHAESLAYIDTSEACDFVAREANPDPVALVEEYVRRDNQGQFLGRNAWLDTAYACPGHLPGPDMFTVVRRSRIASAKLSDTLATIAVTSDVVGIMGQDSMGSVFESGARTRVDTFVVTNTPYGWRIFLPQLPDNVLGSWVLSRPERIRLRDSSRAALVRALDLPHNER